MGNTRFASWLISFSLYHHMCVSCITFCAPCLLFGRLASIYLRINHLICERAPAAGSCTYATPMNNVGSSCPQHQRGKLNCAWNFSYFRAFVPHFRFDMLYRQIRWAFEEAGIFHGDIWPPNVLQAPDGRCVLLTLGSQHLWSIRAHFLHRIYLNPPRIRRSC